MNNLYLVYLHIVLPPTQSIFCESLRVFHAPLVGQEESQVSEASKQLGVFDTSMLYLLASVITKWYCDWLGGYSLCDSIPALAYLANAIHGQTQTSINTVMQANVYDPIMYKLVTNEFSLIKVKTRFFKRASTSCLPLSYHFFNQLILSFNTHD